MTVESREEGGPRFLGIDVGTTHTKAAVCDESGRSLAVSSRRTPYVSMGSGGYHDPDDLWRCIAAVVGEVTRSPDAEAIRAVGVASMAEAGLLVDAATGRERTPIIPWNDPRPEGEAQRVGESADARELFERSGLPLSTKYGLPKILWLAAQDPSLREGTIWLSVADYIVYRMTGRMVTDPTLAARTYVYDIWNRRWDEDWIHTWGLRPGMFPPVLPSGCQAGEVTADVAAALGLQAGTPVAVAGHDHICAALAAGIVRSGAVLDSVGTAEALLGVLPLPARGDLFSSGLAVVPHVVPGCWCWLGGIPSGGASVEWFRGLLGDSSLTHVDVGALLEEADSGPTGIIFFPYLSGSGGPWTDSSVRAALLGLDRAHTRADVLRAVFEGLCYEVEAIRQAAESLTGNAIEELVVVGGGSRWPAAIQIKADTTGCTCVVADTDEATATGAALVAGLGSRLGTDSGAWTRARVSGLTTLPDQVLHLRYREVFDEYMRLRPLLPRPREGVAPGQPSGTAAGYSVPRREIGADITEPTGSSHEAKTRTEHRARGETQSP